MKHSAYFCLWNYMDTKNISGDNSQHRLSSPMVSTALHGDDNAHSSDQDRFIDLKNDVAFKHIFGQSVFMIDFLNDLLGRDDKIAAITYNPTQQVPDFKDEKSVIYDLSCTTDAGEEFIIEMQYKPYNNFRNRALYYVSRKIASQLSDDSQKRKFRSLEHGKGRELTRSEREEHRYDLPPVVGVYLMNFHLENDNPRMVRDVMLTDTLNNNRVFTDRMRMFFIELPAVPTLAEDCKTGLEYWIYVLRNMENLKKIPFTDEKPLFEQLEEKARFYSLTPEEQELYDAIYDKHWVYDATIRYVEDEAKRNGHAAGRAEGRAEGLAEAKLSVALNLKSMGLPAEQIMQATGLTLEQIENL